MTPNENDTPPPPCPPAEAKPISTENENVNENEIAASGPEFSWTWLKPLLVCNPFFLCSAALLLFAVNRLSIDPEFLADDTSNLLFNFFALQFYGLLVVTTALVLVMRRIWYDSALLVVLDHGLLLVPFMLISQATLIGGNLPTILTLTGGIIAIGRVVAVRRWYPSFNLPLRALGLGAVILLANVALPRIFRPLMEIDVQDWSGPNLIAWYVVLPIFAAGANLLARPSRYKQLHQARSWLPLFCYGLWIAGSAVHVWCVAHICALPLRWEHLAPLFSVVVWTLFNRLKDLTPTPSVNLQFAVLISTLPLPFLAFAEPGLFYALAFVNLILYLCIAFMARPHLRRLASGLALASLPLLLTAIPESWGRALLHDYSRGAMFLLAGALGGMLVAIVSARPSAALLGSVGVAIWAGHLSVYPHAHFVVHAFLVALLLHTLRWDETTPRAAVAFVRGTAVAVWMLDSLWWTGSGTWIAITWSTVFSATVLAGWLLRWWLSGERETATLPVAAGLTGLTGPGNLLVQQGSVGSIALVCSLAFFVVGVVVAWTRPRWDHNTSDRLDAGS